MGVKRVLFLRSANYYRSRFAELLFNHLAQEHGLEWSAESRGIVADSSYNPGPIARATLQELTRRNIAYQEPRYPIQLIDDDFVTPQRIIALYEPEHRPMVRQHFPEREQKIEFWRVPELNECSAEQAFTIIQERVNLLIEELRQPGKERGPSK